MTIQPYSVKTTSGDWVSVYPEDIPKIISFRGVNLSAVDDLVEALEDLVVIIEGLSLQCPTTKARAALAKADFKP